MKIEDVMTPCPYKIDSSVSMQEALTKMALYQIRHLPVVQDGDVIGVVTERDLSLSQLVCKSTNFCPTVGQICSNVPPIFDAAESLSEVAGSMADQKADFALVSKDNELVGIFTTVDALRLVQRGFEGR